MQFQRRRGGPRPIKIKNWSYTLPEILGKKLKMDRRKLDKLEAKMRKL